MQSQQLTLHRNRPATKERVKAFRATRLLAAAVLLWPLTGFFATAAFGAPVTPPADDPPLTTDDDLEVSPKGILDEAYINQTSLDLAGPSPDYAAIKSGLLEQLREYHSRFLKEKKVWAELNRDGLRDRYQDANQVRLLVKQYFRTPDEKHFIADIPPLYTLHRNLGRCNEELDLPHLALAHYYASLRYRPLASGERQYTGKVRAQYLSPQEQAAYNNYIQAKDNVENLRRQNRILARDLNVEKSRQALGLANQLGQTQNQFDQNQNQLQAAEQEFKNLQESPLGQYIRQKQAMDGETVYNMARVVRIVENRNKNRLRQEARSNYGTSILHDYTENRDFVGYADLLELAARIDPDNPLYAEKLSDEYTHSQKNAKAVHYTRRYIDLVEEAAQAAGGTPVDAAKVADFHFRMGGLLTNQRKYYHATLEFEAFLKKNPGTSPEQTALVHYYLGDLHFKKTGHFRKAREYFEQWLAGPFGQKPEGDYTPGTMAELKAELRFRQKRFTAYRALASIMKKEKQLNREVNYLRRAFGEYTAVKNRQKEQLSVKNKKEEELAEIKKDLRTKTDEYLGSLYTGKKDELELAKIKWQSAYGTQKSMPIGKVGYRLADLYIRGQAYSRAADVYETLIVDGINVAETRRRRAQIAGFLQ